MLAAIVIYGGYKLSEILKSDVGNYLLSLDTYIESANNGK